MVGFGGDFGGGFHHGGGFDHGAHHAAAYHSGHHHHHPGHHGHSESGSVRVTVRIDPLVQRFIDRFRRNRSANRSPRSNRTQRSGYRYEPPSAPPSGSTNSTNSSDTNSTNSSNADLLDTGHRPLINNHEGNHAAQPPEPTHHSPSGYRLLVDNSDGSTRTHTDNVNSDSHAASNSQHAANSQHVGTSPASSPSASPFASPTSSPANSEGSHAADAPHVRGNLWMPITPTTQREAEPSSFRRRSLRMLGVSNEANCLCIMGLWAFFLAVLISFLVVVMQLLGENSEEERKAGDHVGNLWMDHVGNGGKHGKNHVSSADGNSGGLGSTGDDFGGTGGGDGALYHILGIPVHFKWGVICAGTDYEDIECD